MLNKYLIYMASGISAISHSGIAQANNLRNMTFEQMAKQADIVAIGQIDSFYDPKGSDLEQVAKVKLVNVIKGIEPESIVLLTKGPIHESNLQGLHIGGKYLILVRKFKVGDEYESVNGMRSIFNLQSQDFEY